MLGRERGKKEKDRGVRLASSLATSWWSEGLLVACEGRGKGCFGSGGRESRGSTRGERSRRKRKGEIRRREKRKIQNEF